VPSPYRTGDYHRASRSGNTFRADGISVGMDASLGVGWPSGRQRGVKVPPLGSGLLALISKSPNKCRCSLLTPNRRRRLANVRPASRNSSGARPLHSIMLFKLRNQTTKPEPLWHWLQLPLRYRLRWRTRASLETRQTSARLADRTQAALGTSWSN